MIRLAGLNIRLPNFSLDDVDLEVAQGEFFALIGPTGSGKTLLLDSIAGLIKPNSGRIWIGDREVTGTPPERRGAGIVYQDYALFPHLNVLKNITYGLRYLAADQDLALARTLELSRKLGIDHLLDRSIINLSGGEKQRVCLARALAVEPKVLLLDEPLSALDPNFRDEIQAMLAELHRDTGLTCLMVTHDFNEVRTLAQRAAVIGEGRIRQIGKVHDIFQRPNSPLVARFVGAKNLFPAQFSAGQAQAGPLKLAITSSQHSGAGHIYIRPENIRLLDLDSTEVESPNTFEVSVRAWLDMGPFWEADLDANGLRLRCTLAKSCDDDNWIGRSRARLTIAPEHIHLLPG